MRTSTSTSSDPVLDGAVPKALKVLEYLARSGKPQRLSAIAVALDLQKSTVHRILGSLAGSGYVEQLPDTACYVVTLKLWELGTGVLTILSGDDVLYLDKLLSPRAIKFSTRVGSRVPAVLASCKLFDPGATLSRLHSKAS